MRIGISLDGGGIRGLLSALIAQHIEEQIGRPLWEDADLLFGTSTGGILALGMVRPVEQVGIEHDVTKRPVMPPLVKLYREHGPEMFGKSRWTALKGARGHIYDPSPLLSQLHQVLGNVFMGAARRPVAVTSYDLLNRQARFFKSWNEMDRYVRMKTAALATSAAWPVYFPPERWASIDVGDRSGEPHPLIDGGFVGNNPVMFCLADLERLHPGEKYILISVGTGESVQPIPWGRAKTGGLIRHGTSLIDVMFDASNDAMNYAVRQAPDATLIRLQPRLTVADSAMDNVSPENMAALAGQAEDFIEDNPELIQQAVDALNQRHAQGG